jgi:undecaprenyl-diphosphatase
MFSALQTLDFSIVSHLAAWTVSNPVASTFVWAGAQALIVVPFLVLVALWNNPDKFSRSKPIRKTVVMAAVSLIVALAIKALISFIIARQRPFIAHPGMEHLMFKVDSSSFPSGHTILSFTVALSVWASGLRRTGIVLTLVATLVALCRVAAGVHYPSDILGGITVAGFAVWYVHHGLKSLREYLPNR